MSNTKYLADLLKVCSILPALAIMPAMAEINVVEGDGTPVEVLIGQMDQKADGGRIWLKNFTDGKYTHDTENHTLVLEGDKDGKITLSSASASIQSHNENHTAPNVAIVGDKDTVLNMVTQGEDWNLFSRFAPLTVGSRDSAIGTINLVNDTNDDGSLIYVTAGNNYDDADNQKLEIYGDRISMRSVNTDETLGTAITGNEGRLDLVANESLDIVGGIYGYNEVYGGKSNLIFNINQNEGSTAKTTIVGDIDAAKGSEVNIGLKGTGSSITGNMLVSAEGTTLPGGLINLQFGDEGTITGNITAQDEGVIKITAGDDFNINGNLLATTAGSSIDIQGSDVEIESVNGGLWAENYAKININANKAGEIEISSIDGEAVKAYNNGQVNIGSADVESVEISSVTNNAIYTAYRGAFADKKNSVTNITGKNISISTKADELGAIHVASNTLDIDEANFATVNINGDNILITAPETGVYQGIAIAAMSKGVANIEGNTTIRAQNAILARGDAQVNINKSSENTVKMLGDINFNYNEKTSGSPVNATIDVNLVGEESFWKGNTVVSWDDVNPGDGKLEVSNAKIALKDGAVWNATKITDNKADVKGHYYTALNDLVINGGTVNIMDTERGIMVDRIVANDATFGGGMLNVNESIVIESGVTTFSGNVMGLAADTEKGINGATLTLDSGATMDIGTSTIKFDTMNIDGTVIASVTNGRPYGHLYGDIVAGEDALLKLNVGSVGTYKIFDDEDANMKIDAGLAYKVKYNDEYAVVVETKAVEDLVKDAGISTQAAGAIAGLTQTADSALQKVSLALQQVLNSGDDAMVAIIEKETKKLNPTDKPVAQVAASSVQNQVLSLTSGRMTGGISVGRAGGDERSQENGFWIQGLFNKSKFADAFHGYTRGVALGADTLIDNKWTIGGGLAFNNTDVHADGVNTDIDTKTMFLYGQYKPNNWFVNATATYSMSEYTENKTIAGVVWNDMYDVDAYGAQIMTGYDFTPGITTEAGLRYLHVAQEAHSFVKKLDTDFLSGIAGLKYAFAIENDWAIQLRPELRAAMTYDFISDEATATVVMPGVASYKVDAERLSRMGGEFGIGLTALYKGMEVSLMYDLDLHKDYTSQTGMIKFRGRF